MSDFQTEKKLVMDFYQALDKAHGEDSAAVLKKYTATDFRWRGYHPFNEINDRDQLATAFWAPLKSCFSAMQRRLDIFMAGENTLEGEPGVWVASMGHLMGLFDKPWLGIPPTGKIAMLRYAEFNRVIDGKIAETAFYFDIPHLMMQAGLNPFPPQTGAIERYAEQHSGPFREGFKDRVFNGHVARIAEGSFGGFFGWPNMTLTPAGGFMGMPASEKPGTLRIIDMYRRDGDKLTENWIFIDLLDFWLQQGVDILARMAKVPRT